MKRLSIGQVVRSGCFSIANGYIGRQDSAPWIVMIREKKMEKYWAYRQRGWLLLSCIILSTVLGVASTAWIIPSPPPIDEPVPTGDTGHYLYVATPGIRDYLGYGGHGLLVFDINDHHKFVKRISTKGFHEDGSPSNVKGIAVSVPLNSVYITTLQSMQRIDLSTEEVLWEIPYEGGCDRMSISPDGMTMYLPSLEKDFWNVVHTQTGEVIAKINVHSRAHNTIYGPSGNRAYMADIASPWLHVADTQTHTVVQKIGPFSAGLRPFTINSDESLVFVNVNDLLGFEVGDLKTGEKVARVQVLGWDKGPVRRHGNPSHGIGLTPDEKEIWISDGHNMRMHVFSAEAPYQQLTTIALGDMPGWVTFSIDGQYAYPSSGEVIHAKTRRILYLLQDENYNTVSSEKMIEIYMKDGKVTKAGDQFGLGRLHVAGN